MSIMIGGFRMRVAHAAKNLPYNVNINLPPADGGAWITEDQARLSGPQIDLVPPPCPERHTALGEFLDSWSLLEHMMSFFVEKLLETDPRTTSYVMNTLGAKQIIDLLNSLAALKLSDDHIKRMVTLLERFGKLNSKRNVLVHGHWVLEAVIINKNGHAALRTQFLRETTPPDPRIANLIADPKNQKERVKYGFTLKRIRATSLDATTLNRDLGRFLQEIQLSPAWARLRSQSF